MRARGAARDPAAPQPKVPCQLRVTRLAHTLARAAYHRLAAPRQAGDGGDAPAAPTTPAAAAAAAARASSTLNVAVAAVAAVATVVAALAVARLVSTRMQISRVEMLARDRVGQQRHLLVPPHQRVVELRERGRRHDRRAAGGATTSSPSAAAGSMM